MNLNDIENPISPYIENFGIYNLNPNFQTKIEVFIEPQEVTLEDSFLTLEPAKTHYFNKICDREKLIITNYNYHGLDARNYSPMMIEVRISPNQYQYRRKVLGFLEVTGILGGLFELFEITIGIIIGSISSFTFRSQLIKEIIISEKKNNGLLKELYTLRKQKQEERMQENKLNNQIEEEKVNSSRYFESEQIILER